MPNGWGTAPDGRLAPKLSVLVSPRLTPTNGAGVVGDFADFAAWPAIAAAIRWTVSLGANVYDAVAAPGPAVGVGFDPWAALFPSDTPVRAFALPDLSSSCVFSYPVGRIQDYVRDRYSTIAATNPVDPVPLADLLADLDPFDGNGAQIVDLVKSVELEVRTEGFATDQGSTPRDFAEFLRFYGRPTEFAQLREEKKALPAVQLPELDFHQALALAGHHPFLQRFLSVVIDLQLVPSDVPFPLGPSVEVRARPAPDGSVHSPAPVLNRPRTLATLTSAAFAARSLNPASSDFVDGWLRLDDPTRFAPVHIDPDGTGFKVLRFSDNLRRRETNGTDESPDAYPVPALRAHGLSVARLDRAEKVHVQHFAGLAGNDDDLTSPSNDPGANALLEADQLVRGYRVDVFDPTDGRWRSLMRREGTYDFTGPGGGTVTAVDEGTTSMALTRAVDPTVDGAETDYYLQEELFSWTGWSLAAPRPGRAIVNEDDKVVDTASEPLPDGFQLRLGFRLPPGPGTLPRLRFGRDYRFRARLVDLAGNSIEPPEPADEVPPGQTHFTPPTFYGRFDPVAAPTLLHRTPRVPGEAVERLVIRSDYDEPLDPGERSSRHVVPNKASELLCEELGVFDTSGPGSPLDKAAYPLITEQEPGSFATSPDVLPGPSAPEADRYYPPTFVPIPYMTDPMARAVVLRGLPVVPSGLDVIAYDGQAPFGVQGIRLDLVEGDVPGYRSRSNRRWAGMAPARSPSCACPRRRC